MYTFIEIRRLFANILGTKEKTALPEE